jgi:hypothetical protein
MVLIVFVILRRVVMFIGGVLSRPNVNWSSDAISLSKFLLSYLKSTSFNSFSLGWHSPETRKETCVFRVMLCQMKIELAT